MNFYRKPLILFFFLCSIQLMAQEKDNLHFVTDPTLSPDGSTVVFTYENDLWTAEVATGKAYRLTGMEGIESHPRFSPDGKWMAFSSTKNGNADVFVMPVDGGKIQQLTWHDGADYAESFSWDSRYIYFTSDRYNQFTSFKIPVEGGTPVRMFSNYFNTPHHLVEHPRNGEVFFTESWESYRFAHRKRYKGDHNPDIKSYNTENKIFTKHTEYKGKDFWPTIDREGTVYFVSDRWNEQYNLYKLENGKPVRLTEFKSSTGRPQVSANGEWIVFTLNYQPYLYNVKENKSQPLSLSLYETEFLETATDFKVQDNISSFDVSPDNKKLAFVSRGRLFVSDKEGKFIREMPTNAKERVVDVKWQKENNNLVFSRTDKGWTNLFTISAEGNKPEKQLTDDQNILRALEIDEDRKRLLYIQGSGKLMMLDLSSFKTKTLVEDEFWFRGSKPRFSPDGKHIVYTAYRDFEQDIFIYDLEKKNFFNLTRSGVAERDPFWSPDGKYIYFACDRFHASFPRGTDHSKLYRIPLHKFKKEFKSEKYDALFAEEDKNDTLVPEIKFDLDLLKQRWDELGVRSGQQYDPLVFNVKDETIVLYRSTQDGEYGTWKMVIKPFEKPEYKKISDRGIGNVVKIKKDFYTIAGGDIHKIDLKKSKLEKIDIKHTFSKILQNEFEQMFYENWAILAEYFYDKDFHGIDWEGIRDKYENYLPHVQTRDNMRTLFNDMLGELNSSHLGFSSYGEEEKTFYTLRSAASGIVFDEENPFTVDYVVAKSPLDITDESLQKGDRLVAVNGQTIDNKVNRERYFSFAEMPEELTLTFERKGKTFTTRAHPISSRYFNTLLYDEWIQEKQEFVDKKTNKKIAYVYMKDMGSSSLEDFLIDMTTETPYRDALILDLRYNRGGNVHDDVLQFLSQRPYLKWQARGGRMAPQPNFAPSGKPIVMLVNEHSLSDAEMTAAGFKELGLGTIIGTETYRWIIFTSGMRLVDGSYTRLPTWGCYTLEGKDLEMTGVKPDIYIENTFKNRLEGEDPQLEKAIEFLMKKLEEKP